MKVSNINSELKHSILTMVICGSHMHKFSVSKDMEKKLTMIKGEGIW
jgi:hydrogenase maturation factor